MSKGKRLTYLTISLGVLVLLIAGYAFKDRAVEQWYIWKNAEEWYLKQLDSDSEERRQAAAEKLLYRSPPRPKSAGVGE